MRTARRKIAGCWFIDDARSSWLFRAMIMTTTTRYCGSRWGVRLGTLEICVCSTHRNLARALEDLSITIHKMVHDGLLPICFPQSTHRKHMNIHATTKTADKAHVCACHIGISVNIAIDNTILPILFANCIYVGRAKEHQYTYIVNSKRTDTNCLATFFAAFDMLF